LVKKRIYSYDIIRIVAASAVVMVHVAAPFITRSPIGSDPFVCANTFGALSRLGVQMFVMLSGALILREEREYTFRTMFKSISKLLILLAVWSVFYAVVLPLVLGQELILHDVIIAFWDGHYHLWYLFMLIGLHLITPILRIFAKKQNAKMVLYFVALAVLFEYLPPITNFFYTKYGAAEEVFLEYADKFRIGLITEYTAYYLLGWYLTTVELTKKVRCGIYSLGFLGILLTVLGSVYYSEGRYRAYHVFYPNHTINVFFYSVAAFVLLHYLFRDRQIGKRTMKCLSKISGLTLGIYVIHVFVLEMILKNIPDIPQLIQNGSVVVTILLLWLAVVVISLLVAYLISEIPIVKNVSRS